MQNKNQEMKQQIHFVANALQLEDFVIEKDIYVTRAIAAVSGVSHENYDLVFQGGTSLAKAHRIIERMSEDCDFRIRFKNSEDSLSKAVKRKALRKFRYDLIDILNENGFTHR